MQAVFQAGPNFHETSVYTQQDHKSGESQNNTTNDIYNLALFVFEGKYLEEYVCDYNGQQC